MPTRRASASSRRPSVEFARKGLGGARVDEIAARSKANKRMIYHYFGSKEQLFTAVLEEAYLGIRTAEQNLHLDELPPDEAIEKLVRFTWNYYLAHPEFLTLVNSENLHRARHLKTSEAIRQTSGKLVAMVKSILDRGVAAGDLPARASTRCSSTSPSPPSAITISPTASPARSSMSGT